MESLSRQLAQQALQTELMVETQRILEELASGYLITLSISLQCRYPGPFPHLMLNNPRVVIRTMHMLTGYLQHWVPGTRRGRSCSSWYEYWSRDREDN